MKTRQAQTKRITRETQIAVRLNIDGSGKSSVKTGIPFFDHMLTLFAKHAVIDLQLACKGDLEVDAHHTVEDCGIALGQSFAQALGEKRGIRRYGAGFDPRNPFTGEAHVPMDECLARCVIDFSGRPCLIWRGLDSHAQKRLAIAEKTQDMSSACIWNYCMETNPTTSWRLYSRLSRRRWMLPVNEIRGSPAGSPAPRGNCKSSE
jgi:imidazoleglycerol phosphate dehydratase HisB